MAHPGTAIPQSSTGGYTASMFKRIRVNPCVRVRGEYVCGWVISPGMDTLQSSTGGYTVSICENSRISLVSINYNRKFKLVASSAAAGACCLASMSHEPALSNHYGAI